MRAVRTASGGALDISGANEVEPEPLWVDAIFGANNAPDRAGGGALHRLLRVLTGPEGKDLTPEVAMRLELLPRLLATLDRPVQSADSTAADGGGVAGKFWEGGTGYGTGGTESVWDREEWAKQQERDAQAEVVSLKCVSALMRIFALSNWSDPSTPAGCLSAAPPSAKDAAAIAEMVATSKLSTRLLELMSTDSMVDLAKHRPMYDAAVRLMASIVAGPNPALMQAFEANPKLAPVVSALCQTAASLDTVISRDEDKPFIDMYRNTVARIEQSRLVTADTAEAGGQGDVGDTGYCAILKKLQFGEAHFEVSHHGL
jgi:hypothetical protein